MITAFVAVAATFGVFWVIEPVMYFSILYILPAVMGAVLVQSIVTMRQLRTTLVAVSCAVAVQFVLIPCGRTPPCTAWPSPWSPRCSCPG